MAKLPVYTSNETPHVEADATPATGIYQGIAEGLHSVGEAVTRYQEQQDNSKIAIGASKLHAQITNEWEDLKQNGDITDPETVDKFNQSAGERIDALTDNISTPSQRARAAEVAQTLKAGFQIKTLADHSTAVGQQAVDNIDTMEKNYSSSVYQDPHSLDETAALIGFTVAGSGIPANKVPAQVLKMTRRVAESAVDGLIEQGNPQKAIENLAGGAYDKYFDGPKKMELVAKANGAINAAEVAKRAAETEARRQADAISEAVRGDYSAALADPNTDQQAWMRSVLQDHSLKPEAQQALVGLQGTIAARGREALNEEQPGILQGFVSQMAQGNLTQAALTDALGKGLSIENYKYLSGQITKTTPADRFENRTMTQLLTEVKAKIGNSGPLNLFGGHTLTPDQEHQLSTAQSWIMRTLQGEKDPVKRMQMMTPGSKTYLLNGNWLPTSSGPQDAVQALVQQDQRAATPTAAAPAARPSLDSLYGGK